MVNKDDRILILKPGHSQLFLLMSVFSKSFLSLVSGDLMSFSLFSARHDYVVYKISNVFP